jgi:hypothetical protein
MVTMDGRMIVVGCNYGAGQLIKLFRVRSMTLC